MKELRYKAQLWIVHTFTCSLVEVIILQHEEHIQEKTLTTTKRRITNASTRTIVLTDSVVNRWLNIELVLKILTKVKVQYAPFEKNRQSPWFYR